MNTSKIGYITPLGKFALIRHQPLLSQPVIVARNESVGRLEEGDYSLVFVPGFDPIELVVFELKAPYKKLVELSGDPGYYEKTVNVRPNQKGINKSHYPNNNMIVAWCADPKLGNWIIYQMMLVSQDGEFFLTYEKMASPQFLKNPSGNLVCPELDGKWQHLKSALLNWMKKRGYGENAKSIYAQDDDDFSLVIEWDSATGNGKVTTKYGDAFVTWRACPQRTEGGRRYLRVGEKVVVKATHKINNPTSISLHATEVVLP